MKPSRGIDRHGITSSRVSGTELNVAAQFARSNQASTYSHHRLDWGAGASDLQWVGPRRRDGRGGRIVRSSISGCRLLCSSQWACRPSNRPKLVGVIGQPAHFLVRQIVHARTKNRDEFAHECMCVCVFVVCACMRLYPSWPKSFWLESFRSVSRHPSHGPPWTSVGGNPTQGAAAGSPPGEGVARSLLAVCARSGARSSVVSPPACG